MAGQNAELMQGAAQAYANQPQGWSGAGPLMGYKPGVPPQANPAAGFDLKGALSQMAMQQMMKELNPQQRQLAPIQAMPVYGGLRGPITMGKLYGNY